MTRRTIQIADDHLMFADPSGRYLAMHHEVFPPITSLDDVNGLLRERAPDVLFLDISFGKRSSLPKLTGFVKASPRTAIVMVTGHADREMVTTALDAGARGYIVKDGGPAELLLAIETVLSGEIYLSAELREDEAPARYRLKRAFSERQREVLLLLRRGSTVQMIADALNISLSTAEKHVLGVKRRLGIDETKRSVAWSSLCIEGLGAKPSSRKNKPRRSG